jgi:tetrahydromethanopterin S-methyltransferase subunit A
MLQSVEDVAAHLAVLEFAATHAAGVEGEHELRLIGCAGALPE